MAISDKSRIRRKNPWLAGDWRAGYGKSFTTERNLFGQDQLVFARHAEQVTLTGVLNLNGAGTTQNLFAIDPQRLAGRRRRARGLCGLSLAIHDCLLGHRKSGKYFTVTRTIVNNVRISGLFVRVSRLR